MEKSLLDGFVIPAKPEVLNQLQEIKNQAEPDLKQFSDLVAKDVGLSAAVLKVINSASYGMCRTISEIQQSVYILGIEKVYTLVVAHFLKNSFKGQFCISLDRFWDESTDLANIMVFLVNNLDGFDSSGHKIKEKAPQEQIYTYGLFQNCGIPLLAQKYQDYHEVLKQADMSNTVSIRAENQQYRTDHAVLGYYICKSWNLPKPICEYVLRHHDLEYLQGDADDVGQIFWSILKLADLILSEYKSHKASPEWHLCGNQCLAALGLDDDDLVEIKDEVFELLDGGV